MTIAQNQKVAITFTIIWQYCFAPLFRYPDELHIVFHVSNTNGLLFTVKPFCNLSLPLFVQPHLKKEFMQIKVKALEHQKNYKPGFMLSTPWQFHNFLPLFKVDGQTIVSIKLTDQKHQPSKCCVKQIMESWSYWKWPKCTEVWRT